MRAFGEGVLAGFGIAIPVGPIAVLIVDLGMRQGPRLALAAGLGAATADFLYASIAAVAGLAAAQALEPYADGLRVASVATLAVIVIYRTWRLVRPAGAEGGVGGPDGSIARTYAGFLGLTLMNPMTVTYFAALILGLQAGVARDAGGKALFAVGAFAASALWQSSLAGTGAVFHRRLPGRARLVTGLVGNFVIAALALRLALAA